jgi:GT2 family glycosyltransferase
MKVLMCTAGVRWFPTCKYWIDQITFLDKLLVKYYNHEEAFQIIRNFFLEHKEYTHLLIYAEDVLATPDSVKLLIKDAEEYNYPVVTAWFNFDFKRDWIAISTKDLSRERIVLAEQYNFLKPTDMLFYDSPFMEVTFTGMPLTLIRRDVVEKVTFKPYSYTHDKILGTYMKRGTMFDLQFCLECRSLGIPIVLDKRAFAVHFGDTRRFINLRNGQPSVDFIPASVK